MSGVWSEFQRLEKMSDELQLTTEEQTQLLDLLDPNVEVEIIIPESIDPDKLFNYLGLCCKASCIGKRMDMQSQAMIGRMLWLIKRDGMFRQWGFPSYSAFITDWVTPKMNREKSTVYNTMAIAENFPTISPARYEKIGPAKLNLLKKFTNETKRDVEEHLERAERMTKHELTVYAEQQGYIARGEATPAVINIITTAEVAGMWKKLRHDPGTIEKCGTEDPGLILLHLMEEWAGAYGVDLS